MAQKETQKADDAITHSFTLPHAHQPNHASRNLNVEIVFVELLSTKLAGPRSLVAASLLNLPQPHDQFSMSSCRLLRVVEHTADLCAQDRCRSFLRDNYQRRSSGFARSQCLGRCFVRDSRRSRGDSSRHFDRLQEFEGVAETQLDNKQTQGGKFRRAAIS